MRRRTIRTVSQGLNPIPPLQKAAAIKAKTKTPGAKAAPGATCSVVRPREDMRPTRRCGLGPGHGVHGREGAVGHGDVDFPDWAIDFGGTRGSFEAIGKQEAFEGDAVGPDTFEGHDIFSL